ncbi:MAG: hypothetical protein IPJ37_00685 [Bacteroidales bacterium]|nr:hypothetical protein [Bacteroidales bacterium]
MTKAFCYISFLLYAGLCVQAQDLIKPVNPVTIYNITPGYITINEFTGSVGLGSKDPQYSDYFFGVTTLHGYQLNKHFLAAGGTGVLFYDKGYFYGDGGVLLNSKQVIKLFVNPGIGIKYFLTNHLVLTAGAGMWVQADIRRDSFLNFKLGIAYKPK